MRVSVVSDVHGNIEGLARVAKEADFLIVLGDLLEYVDYGRPEKGILGILFGSEAVSAFASFRIQGRFDEMHALERELWNGLPNPAATLTGVIREQYRAIIDVVGPQTLLTLGNVDEPVVWDSVAPAPLKCQDGTVVELDGVRLGFVAGGALKRPVPGSPWSYFERSHDVYRTLVNGLGPIDVLCTHVPPDLEDLRYDMLSHRKEMFGPGLLELVDRQKPALAVFGHVHNPRARELRRGSTDLVNVGHFKRTNAPFVFDTDLLRS